MTDENSTNAPLGGAAGPGDDVSVWEAIQAFETILQVFPEDVSALESLAVAYEQAGDAVHAREKNIQLANILARQADWARVEKIVAHLVEQNPDDAEAKELLQRARAELGPEAGRETGAEPGATEAPGAAAPSRKPEYRRKELAFDLRGELELAWNLLQHDLITQECYEKAIEALTERRMKPAANTSLALLQELASMDRVNTDKIMDFLVNETNMPLVNLTRFDIDPEIAAGIPLGQCIRAGVLPFERIGPEIMVAIQNPVDDELKQAVREYLGGRVHFYLTPPEDFAAAVSKIEQFLNKQKNEA